MAPVCHFASFAEVLDGFGSLVSGILLWDGWVRGQIVECEGLKHVGKLQRSGREVPLLSAGRGATDCNDEYPNG